MYETNMYSSLMEKTTQIKNSISLQNIFMFIIFLNFLINACLFIMLIVVEENVKPSYNEIQSEIPQIKQILTDLDEIMPQIKNSFNMLNNFCNSIEYKHLCGIGETIKE